MVQTAHNILIYDAGPKYPGGFDAGAEVVVPYLRAWGISDVDQMVISHGDNDYIGGTMAIIQQVPGEVNFKQYF